MKKIYFLVAFILGGIHFSFGQEEVKNELNLILPSSTSYSLGTYGQHSIGMFTGTVQEQIELYNYKVKDLVVPITLSYSSNGIKVDQAENNVGIGWVLNAGGVITRVVNGKADEYRSNKLPPDAYCHDQEMVNYVYHNVMTKQDTEPDLFLFNFLGRSGQFTLDDNKQVLLLEQEDLEIKMLKGTDQNYYFTVRDERGVTYVFDQRETTSTEYTHSNDSAVTAWYLKSITSPKGTVVYFEYKQDSQSFDQVASQSITKITKTNSCSNRGPKERWRYSTNKIHTFVTSVALSRVYSNNPQDGEIELKYDYRRPYNAVSIREPILISEVIFRDSHRQEVDNIKFNYTTTRSKRTFLEGMQFKEPNKMYHFEYYNAERLNERFGNKDAWGYNSSRRGDFPDPIKNYMLVFETRLGYEKYVSVGDKYTDLDYVQAGLLKKIVFPTKGYSEFNYEANRVWGPDFIPAKYNYASMNLMYGSQPAPVYFKTLNEYTVEAKLSSGFYDPNYNPGGAEYPIDREGFYYTLKKESPKDSGRYVNVYSHLTTERMDQPVVKKLSVDAFTRYKLEGYYTGYTNDRVGLIEIKYKISNDTIIERELAQNGVRVSRILSYKENDKLTSSKNYTYVQKDGSTSGNHYFNKYQYMSGGKEFTNCENNEGFFYDDSTTFHTNSLLPMQDAIGEGRVAFGRVVEEIQYANATSSTIEYLYQVNHGSLGHSCIGGIFAGPLKWTKSDWGHGLLLEKNSFNEKQEQVQSERYEYTEDVLKRKQVRGLATEIQFMPAVSYTNNGTNINPLNIEHIGYTMYSVNSFRSYLKSITTIDYTGNKQMQEKKTFEYSSSNHYQKTKMEVANETTTITEQYVYPDDILSSTSLIGEPLTTGEYQEINRLKKTATHQPAALIQTSTYKDGTLNGISRNLYKNWNNTPLYHKTISSKGTGNFNPADFQVTHYNKNSKVEETEDQSGSKTVYLYGYGQTLLIARIQNATKEQVASALGVSIANLVTINETKLTQLNNLRTNAALKDALITTYEHKPLVGITKMTDPKGSSMSYEYDLFNRLKAIKDNKGNIIEEYEYNYKNNQ